MFVLEGLDFELQDRKINQKVSQSQDYNLESQS